jgi:catechol 2,3-dioxygenase-like lactoylglutathione lyase family enzyme
MTQTVPQTTEAATPHWRGINHVALITTDMDATLRFYHGTLGARLVATIATPEFRHYFFEFGPQCTVAFFEYADTSIKPFTKSAGVPDPRAAQFDHLSLDLPDEDALIDLRTRLAGADCEVTQIIDHGGVRSVYFTDPNGIALEASWWVHDPTSPAVTYNDAKHFADPNPVPAVVELQTTGNVSHLPSAHLA